MHSLDVPQKRCKGPCDARLPFYMFGKDASTPDGRKRWCMDCKNKRQKERYWANIEANRDYHRLYQRKRRAKKNECAVRDA